MGFRQIITNRKGSCRGREGIDGDAEMSHRGAFRDWREREEPGAASQTRRSVGAPAWEQATVEDREGARALL